MQGSPFSRLLSLSCSPQLSCAPTPPTELPDALLINYSHPWGILSLSLPSERGMLRTPTVSFIFMLSALPHVAACSESSRNSLDIGWKACLVGLLLEEGMHALWFRASHTGKPTKGERKRRVLPSGARSCNTERYDLVQLILHGVSIITRAPDQPDTVIYTSPRVAAAPPVPLPPKGHQMGQMANKTLMLNWRTTEWYGSISF